MGSIRSVKPGWLLRRMIFHEPVVPDVSVEPVDSCIFPVTCKLIQRVRNAISGLKDLSCLLCLDATKYKIAQSSV